MNKFPNINDQLNNKHGMITPSRSIPITSNLPKPKNKELVLDDVLIPKEDLKMDEVYMNSSLGHEMVNNPFVEIKQNIEFDINAYIKKV